VIADIVRMATNTYISPSMVSQAIVYEFCKGGGLERSIGTVKEALRERRDALCAALARDLPDARFNPPQGGYFLWVDLPDGTDVAALMAAAKERGLVFVPGTDFFMQGGESSLRIAYSGVTVEQIDEGVARLADAYAGVTQAVA
jgi:DNA-binding transcriptional MocR family regulator